MNTAVEAVVAEEVAEIEFKRMCEANRVEIPAEPAPPPENATEEQLAQYKLMALSAIQELAEFSAIKRPLMKAMMKGTLTVEADGQPSYVPVKPNPNGVHTFRFKQLYGAVFIAMEKAPREQVFARLVIAASTLSGAPQVQIQNMCAEDFGVCCAVAQLFLSQG